LIFSEVTMRLRPRSWLPYTTLALAWLHGPLGAAQLNLAQSPPGAGREPSPNIIVSVDDSGSMGATGIATLKSALQQTFAETNVPDDRIRLAWQSMNRCRGIPSASTACGSLNGMRPLLGTHRSNFMTWVNTLTPNNGTPSHLMIDEAGKYLSRTDLGINSPWAATPGTQETPLLSCRKSFHIFMTDGGWNSAEATNTNNHVDTSGPDYQRITRGGNADGTAFTLPDGVQYAINSDQTRLYRDSWGGTGLSTLSDLAFYYWSRDLQPGLTNNVRKSPKDQLPAENFGTTANPATLESYWNPRNNPATWQHMVNYTIGFNDAATWTGAPTFSGDTFAGLAPLIRGTSNWPSPFCGTGNNSACDGGTGYNARENERKVELWHAALNSRGRFVPAPNAAALVTAFQGILDDILTQTANPLVSIASSSSRLRTDGFAYVAGFNSERWSGDLGAYTIAAGTNVVSSTPTWTAASQLDAATFNVTNRLVLTTRSDTLAGTPFLFANLSNAQKTAIQGGDSATVGTNRVNYVRGDRTQEVQNGGTLRRRDSRLGDIVNSNIWHTGRPLRMSFEHTGHAAFRNTFASRTAVLYVGANDGMLHAFNAATGQELMAYVPQGVYANLRGYTLTNYGHRFFVDGHPFTGDVDTSGSGTGNGATPTWKTMLIGGLAGGGKGYFVLDVTNPVAFGSNPTTFAATGVVMDKTDGADADVGHIYSLPVVDAVTGTRAEQVVKLNNGRWAVIMGNGVNSTNERPVLLIQYLDGSKELLKIVANSTTGQSNGLSAPRLVDVNGDGKMDVAYAGDLQGNLWKFNLTQTTDSQWGVSNWSGGTTTCKNATNCAPLYVAQDGSSTRQPISAAPLWIAHPLGGVQVLFGTGRNLQDADRTSTSVQTIYSLWDKSTYTSPGGVLTAVDGNNITTGRSALVQQTVVGAVTSTASGAEAATDYYNTSENTIAYSRADNTAKRGWYLDLPASRERVLANPQLFEGQKTIIGSTVPKTGASGETCDFDTVTEDNWINVFNMISGAPSKTPVFSTTDTSMNLAKSTRTRFGSGEYISINKSDGNLDLISFVNSGGPGGGGGPPPTCNPAIQLCTVKKTLTTGTVPGARADWREAR
jgi:type IV pilus assembly protein PilY1